MRRASRWSVVRFGGFSCGKGFGGAIPGVGRRVPTQSVSQKGTDRLSLHGATSGSDDPLPRRARPSESPHLPTCCWLVPRWPSHQSASRLRPWTGQGLGLWGLAAKRRARAHLHRSVPQYRRLHGSEAVDRETPDGVLYLLVDNLSSHTSAPIKEWPNLARACYTHSCHFHGRIGSLPQWGKTGSRHSGSSHPTSSGLVGAVSDGQSVRRDRALLESG